eukprot:scaffold87167_cov19-Prasinocladus_malaysianus.AAC.1
MKSVGRIKGQIIVCLGSLGVFRTNNRFIYVHSFQFTTNACGRRIVIDYQEENYMFIACIEPS